MPDWYRKWAMDHVVALGLGEAGIKTVLSWGAVFPELFTADELQNATRDLMARTDTATFVDKQRGQIIAAIEARRNRLRAKEYLPSDYGCKICAGEGWAIVPHPGVTEHGVLYGYLRRPRDDPQGMARELAVACSCDKGQRTAARIRTLSLAAYSNQYPDWSDIKAERDALRLAELQTPSAYIPDWEQLKRELAERMKIPRRGAA